MNDPDRRRWSDGFDDDAVFADIVAHLNDDPPQEPAVAEAGGQVFKLMEATTAETRQEPSLDPHAPGALKLAGGFSIHLKADGKDLGELSPGSKAPLSPGTHQLELTNPRHFYKDVRAVTVVAGQMSTLTVPGLATLTVETFPGTGKVLVDGQDSGIESDGSTGIQVAQGRHTITVRGAKGSKTETVDLAGD